MTVPHLAKQSARAEHLVQRLLRAMQRSQPEGTKPETGDCNTLGQSSSRSCDKLSEEPIVPRNQTWSALEHSIIIPRVPSLRKERVIPLTSTRSFNLISSASERAQRDMMSQTLSLAFPGTTEFGIISSSTMWH